MAYAAQASPKIDTARAEKNRFRMETRYTRTPACCVQAGELPPFWPLSRRNAGMSFFPHDRPFPVEKRFPERSRYLFPGRAMLEDLRTPTACGRRLYIN